jgi:hypothetical protein
MRRQPQVDAGVGERDRAAVNVQRARQDVPAGAVDRHRGLDGDPLRRMVGNGFMPSSPVRKSRASSASGAGCRSRSK